MLKAKHLMAVNRDKNNIFEVGLPFYYFNYLNQETGSDKPDRNWVIFLGNDFKSSTEYDWSLFTKKINECLDYVRKNCPGYKLYYKPHPGETDEYKYLNFESFEIIKDTNTAELFYLQNLGRIKYVFCAISQAALVARNMGLNSYSFSRCFKDIAPKFVAGYEGIYEGAPDSFFIESFHQKLEENKITFQKDTLLEDKLKEVLKNKNGVAWLITNNPYYLVTLIEFTRIIKRIEPKRKVNFIVLKHHRWQKIDMSVMKSYFDEIFFLPHIRPSLRPWKMWRAIKAAVEVKKFKIEKDDILFSMTISSFSENCLLSYNKQIGKVALFDKELFDATYIEPPKGLERKKFKKKLTIALFNLIMAPILRINMTFSMQYGEGMIFNISRYRKPVNNVYDWVFIFKPVGK